MADMGGFCMDWLCCVCCVMCNVVGKMVILHVQALTYRTLARFSSFGGACFGDSDAPGCNGMYSGTVCSKRRA